MSNRALATDTEADAGDNAISVRNLQNQFAGHVVHDKLNLDVRRGEVLSIVGGSGAGKSVLLRSILGLNPSCTGQIELLGQDVLGATESEVRKVMQRVGVLFQHGALFSSLSVIENVATPLLEIRKASKSDAIELAQSKLLAVGLDENVFNKSPADLSGGMVKRVALARALVLDPDVLFLDEPTAGLDPISASSFDELVCDLRRTMDLTVFMVTHDLDTIHAITDRVAVLANRQVLVVDSLERVAQHDDPWIQAYFRGPRGRAALRNHVSLGSSAELNAA